jgi:hypothetical protein
VDGRLKGSQFRATVKCDDACEAVIWMQQIADGVQHDLILNAGYTAHAFSFETEIAHDLGECGGASECAWCREQAAYAAADAAYDLREGL